MRTRKVASYRVLTNMAFTLVELLVVISIMALLMAILLPSLKRARDQAKEVACRANVRSLAHAMLMYSEDHRDNLPNGNPPNTGIVGYSSGTTVVLLELNNRYLRSPGVFRCPSDKDPAPTQLITADYDVRESARLSYDFYSVWWMSEHGPQLTRIRHAPLTWDLKGGRATPHHQQNHGTRGGNVAYADGHADWQPQPQWDRENWPSPAHKFYRP